MLKKLITTISVCTPLLLALIVTNCGNHNKPTNWSQRKIVSFKELQNDFNQPDMIYAPFAFWFWDAPLDADLAAKMAEEMCQQRMNPGYAHPRKGLPHEQWLSPQWFESVNAALKKAAPAGD